MSAQHTPGPWTVNPKAALIDASDGESICLMRWPTTVRTEAETTANARLIAAAPDLLEALESIAEYWNRDQNETAMANACWYAIQTAEAALAKAKGEQP